MTRTDLTVGLLLTVVGLLEARLGLTGAPASWGIAATVPLVTAPVALRRTRPPLAVSGLVLGCLLQTVLGSDLPGGLAEGVALVLVTYSVGTDRHWRRSLTLGAVVLAGAVGVVLLGDEPRPGNLVYAATVVALAWTAGYAVRVTRERGELAAEQLLMAERSRLAGELHDVVAHHVTAIVIRAGAERLDLPADSHAADAWAGIEEQGRETLTELRTLLGVLHVDGAAPLAPQPGIADLPDLVRSAADAGVTVTVRSEGIPRPVGAASGLTVYRVVQEALTNVRKHSEGATATVSLRWLTDRLDIDVHDPGPTRRTPRFGVSGWGLQGMAERVRAHGGSVDAGVDGVGFRVQASVPVEAVG